MPDLAWRCAHTHSHASPHANNIQIFKLFSFSPLGHLMFYGSPPPTVVACPRARAFGTVLPAGRPLVRCVFFFSGGGLLRENYLRNSCCAPELTRGPQATLRALASAERDRSGPFECVSVYHFQPLQTNTCVRVCVLEPARLGFCF